jgi:hypothetical protein
LSERGPATADPTTDPAARAEPIAPWITPAGEWKKSRYWCCTTMADMDEMSKPKLRERRVSFGLRNGLKSLTGNHPGWR